MKIKSTTSDAAVLGEIGKRLAQYRLNINWPQHKLAKEAGISLPTIKRLEAGESVQALSLLRVMRVLELLPNLEVAIPEVLESPIQKVNRMGKRRKRASSINKTKPTSSGKWTWGDDE
ncbi:helix-turn-helix transcriptional regulator [bacterium]|nr:helix-turn-helix transcriptional regulator [bacterium]